ncbi:hypothetical protein N665_0432s0027 [Sinapis alba]|nr:hypothetical protein N665_0432s0027 [Sinapis alba]
MVLFRCQDEVLVAREEVESAFRVVISDGDFQIHFAHSILLELAAHGQWRRLSVLGSGISVSLLVWRVRRHRFSGCRGVAALEAFQLLSGTASTVLFCQGVRRRYLFWRCQNRIPVSA